MKKIFILSALISLTIFTACNKEDMSAYQEETFDDITTNIVQADFTINNEDKTLSESGELLLTNNSVNAVSYHWDFGNGNISTEANPTFDKYNIHGIYPITLTVTDALGKTHQTSQEVVVLCIFGGALHEF